MFLFCMHELMYLCMYRNESGLCASTVFDDIAHGFLDASHMKVKLQLIGLRPASQICMYVSYVCIFCRLRLLDGVQGLVLPPALPASSSSPLSSDPRSLYRLMLQFTPFSSMIIGVVYTSLGDTHTYMQCELR